VRRTWIKTCQAYSHMLTDFASCAVLAYLSPNSITPTFTETSPRGKSWTQVTKVADTNHLDMSRCLRQSPRQSPRQVPDKVADLSRTQIMKVGDVICVADFHDLCPRLCRELVPDFVALPAAIGVNLNWSTFPYLFLLIPFSFSLATFSHSFFYFTFPSFFSPVSLLFYVSSLLFSFPVFCFFFVFFLRIFS